MKVKAVDVDDDDGIVRVRPPDLQAFVLEVLIAEGADAAMASDTAAGLVHASLRGVDSHGVRLLPHYIKGLRGGRINRNPAMRFERRAAAVGYLDADHAFGHHAGTVGMRQAISIAKESGIGTVGVANSSHCGALAYLALPAASAGMMGIVMTHATPRIRTPGGRQPVFGNNPLCVVAPVEGSEPFCFDAATSTSTFNAIRMAADRREELQPGVAADASGHETTDATLAEQLIPIGDYKGYGLSMAVDVFCGLLTGMPAGLSVSQMFDEEYGKKRKLGHFIAAVNLDAFTGASVFADRMALLTEQVHGVAPSPEATHGPTVPGEPEERMARERAADGIPLDANLADQLERLTPSVTLETGA